MHKPPCLKCMDRKIGCHSYCEKYKVFLKKNEEIKLKRKKNELVKLYIVDETYKNWKAREGTKRKIKGIKE